MNSNSFMTLKLCANLKSIFIINNFSVGTYTNIIQVVYYIIVFHAKPIKTFYVILKWLIL